jgi:hypothetical protein
MPREGHCCLFLRGVSEFIELLFQTAGDALLQRIDYKDPHQPKDTLHLIVFGHPYHCEAETDDNDQLEKQV